MKKITVILLVLLAMLLSACAGGNSAAPPNTASQTQGSAGSSGSVPSATEQTKPALPDPSTLLVMVYDRGNMSSEYGTPVDNKWVKLIQEAMLTDYNLTVNYHPVPRNEDNNQINVLMAAQNAPDICFTYTTTVWQNYAQQGGLSDMGPSIEKYGDNILDHCKDVLPYGQYESKQLGIHAKRTNVAQTGSYIRKDWVDALGMTMQRNEHGFYAVTTDWLYDYMMAATDANLDGAPDNQIWGTSGYGTTYYWHLHLLEAFYLQEECTDEIRAIYPEFLFPGAKEGYRYLNKMFNDGLIYPDFALIPGQMDKTLYNEHIANGNIGVWFNDSRYGVGIPADQGGTGANETLRQNTPTAEITAFDLINAQGAPAFKKRYPPTGFIIFVPVFSKNVDGAVMYLNWLANWDNDRVLRYGFEGEHYQMIDGVPTTIDTEYNSKTRISVGDLALMYNGNPNADEEAKASVITLADPDKIINAESDGIALVNSWSPFSFASIIQTEMDYGVALDEKEGELRVKVIMCAPDQFDATWDSLVNEYLSLGGQAVIDEKQAVYDEFYK